MLSAFLVMKLLTLAAAIAMGVAIVARDPGLRVNRLIGALLACVAWWSLCEVLWTLQDDAERAAQLIRASSLGWIAIGPVLFDLFTELVGSRRGVLRRLRPVFYVAASVSCALYVVTPWCLVAAVPTAWGWGTEFGSLFFVPYLAASLPVAWVLIGWGAVHSREGSFGERRISRLAFVSVGLATTAATLTDATLPYSGVQVPPLGSTAIAVAGLALTWRFWTYGFSLLSAGAFAQEILATLGDGVVLFHPDRRIRHCNPAFERLAGGSARDLHGRSLDDVVPGLGDDLEAPPPARELALERLDGERIPILVAPPVLCRAGGRLAGGALVVRDLREVVELRSRLVTSARMAAVGDLSAGIAREITRPADAIRVNLNDLRGSWAALQKHPGVSRQSGALHEALTEGEELIDESLEGVARIQAIAREVRGFAREPAADPETTDAREILEGALRMVAPRIPAGVRVVRSFEITPRLRGSSQELQQVVLNLLVNALHAVGDKGEIRLSCGSSEGLVWIRVEDDGCGMSPALVERIFDPFFTTKPVGEGTGLGLAISYHIIKGHGGDVRVSSRPGAGSVLTIELPAASAAEGPGAEPEHAVRVPQP